MRRISSFALALALAGTAGVALAGPYTEAGLASTDPAFVGWATGFQDLNRGPIDARSPSLGLASFGGGADALDSPTANPGVVSLGDGGAITLTFAAPIVDGPGADLAVFENGFGVAGRLFAEFAFVEVSSDGATFARFPSVSLTPTDAQVGGFGTIDPTDVFNLAGKHPAGTGTPFDLASIAGTSGVDANAIRFVRIVDVVGSIDPAYGSRDSLGNFVNDPFPTPFASGGFDLDAVGVIHASVPEPTALALLALPLAAMRRRR